jgi:hypothetical protein
MRPPGSCREKAAKPREERPIPRSMPEIDSFQPPENECVTDGTEHRFRVAKHDHGTKRR